MDCMVIQHIKLLEIMMRYLPTSPSDSQVDQISGVSPFAMITENRGGGIEKVERSQYWDNKDTGGTSGDGTIRSDVKIPAVMGKPGQGCQFYVRNGGNLSRQEALQVPSEGTLNGCRPAVETVKQMMECTDGRILCFSKGLAWVGGQSQLEVGDLRKACVHVKTLFVPTYHSINDINALIDAPINFSNNTNYNTNIFHTFRDN
ncbi:hypothetical protein F4604DRAFT_1904067 [Suillus subluteus]|nr:hypothetical protein F4604DRAFT_1904067 [Suillus subluteus]